MAISQAPALALFDIDGTLLRRAGPHHREALIEAVRRVTGYDTTTDGIPVQGMLDPIILAEMMSRAGAGRALIRQSMPEVERAAERYYRRVCPPLDRKHCPGVEPLLDRLRRRGFLLALVTGNQATTYANRTRQHLWSIRPSILLVLSSAADLLIASTLASRGIAGRLLAKLEYLNPGFSKKDRVARQMIEDAEIAGLKAEREAAVQNLVVQAEDKVVQQKVADRVAAITAPRTIDSEARQRMKSILTSVGHNPIKISAYNSNAESVDFAQTLADIFKESGWKVEGPTIGLSGTGPMGIWVQVPLPKDPLPVEPRPADVPPMPKARGAQEDGLVAITSLPSPVRQLVQALEAGGVKDINYLQAANLNPGDLDLFIGGKVPH